MSAPRLDPLKPDALDEAQRRLYDAVLESPRGQGPARRIILRDDETLSGPFDAWLRTPALGIHLERAGMAFRTDTSLPDAAREVAVLVVAQAWTSTPWRSSVASPRGCSRSVRRTSATIADSRPGHDSARRPGGGPGLPPHHLRRHLLSR